MQLPIREFGADVYQVLGNAEKAQEWLRNFHDGLVYGIRGKSSFADKLMDEAKAYSESQSERAKSRWSKAANGAKGGRPRKNFPDTRGGSASPAGCAAGKRIPPQESTTAAGESADPILDGGSAASDGSHYGVGEADISPEISESGDAANRCFASPAEGCASSKRIPPQESTTAAGESAAPLECGLNGGSAERAGGFYGPLPPTTAELYDFAEAARLNEADAREWWELCTERGWKDRSGKPIRDWKAACERYCARRAINRMAKGET